VRKVALEKRAVSIADWLARRILDAGSLVEPYPFDPLATTRTYAQKLVEATLARHARSICSRERPAAQGARLRHRRLELRPRRDEGRGAHPHRPRAGARSGGKPVRGGVPLLDEKGGAAGALTVGWPVREGDDQKVFLSKGGADSRRASRAHPRAREAVDWILTKRHEDEGHVAISFASLCCARFPARAATEALRLAGRTELPG